LDWEEPYYSLLASENYKGPHKNPLSLLGSLPSSSHLTTTGGRRRTEDDEQFGR